MDMKILLFKELKNFDYDKHSGELYNKVEAETLKDRKKILSEGAFIGFVDVFRTDKFVYLQAYKEYKREGGLYNGNPNKLTPTLNTNGELHSIIITSNGFILHEHSSLFHNEDIKELLMRTFKSLGLHNVSIKDVTSFDIKTMRTFYKSAKRVISLRIREIGKVAPNPQMPPEHIEEATQDMANGTNEISMTSGTEKNLKDSHLINEGLAKRSDITEVRGVDEDGDTFTIGANGRIFVHLPDDSRKRANKLYKMIEKILGIFH